MPSSPGSIDRLFVAVQERNEQTPVGADGGGGGGGGGGRKSPTAAATQRGAGGAAASSPPSLTDRRRELRKTSSGGAFGGEGGVSESAVAVELRDGNLLPGRKPRSAKAQLVAQEEEERGAEAVAAVAAAVRAGGATAPAATSTGAAGRAGRAGVEEGAFPHSSSMSPIPASMGFATPSAASRPAMAPFSVSDTSDFEDAMSPVEGGPLRRGSRGSEAGARASQAPVAEGQEGEEEADEEGGVEGVAEVAAAAAALGFGKIGQGDATGGAGGIATPFSPTSQGESETFFDAEEPSAGAAGGGEKVDGEGKGAPDGASGGLGKALVENGGVAGAEKELEEEEEGAHGEDDKDSLSGDGVGWKQAVGLVAPSSSGGVEARGSGSAEEQAGSTESSEPGAAGASVADADSEWSCSMVRDADTAVGLAVSLTVLE